MYKANLNYDRFNKYFNDFVRKGFIVEAGDPHGYTSYVISERGRTFLAALRKAQALFEYEK